VAIKVLPPVLAKNKRAVENLRGEAITAIKLNHPNIVRLYGFHSDGDIKFLVMEYIDGVTLEEKIFSSPSKKLNLDKTISIAEQIAKALDYAHSQSPPVIHRDLKSSNVMIDTNGNVKVLDFGIAREIHDSFTTITGKTDTSGTLPYMSPEQVRGQRPTPSMDIYSLGIICYECLNGKVPFYTGQIDYQIVHEKPALIEGIVGYINDVLQKVLAKEAADRPKTAKELIELFKAKPQVESKREPVVKEIRRITQSKPEVVDKTLLSPEPAKSKRGLWMVAGLVIIGIIAVITLVNQQNNRKDIGTNHTSRSTTSQTKQAEVSQPLQQKPPSAVAPVINSHPPAGDVVTNSIGMKLVYIPPGEYMMGSPSSERNRDSDEGPQHSVKISNGFYMGIYEVTQSQYQAIMGSNPSYFKGDNNPVEQVGWNDAVEFCRRLSQKEGKTYRLPTEGEWEYACRAGTQTRFSFGDNSSDLGDYAWYTSNSGYQTHPVGQKKPNSFGLYDMHGNVWEWCQDWYDENYYKNSPSIDPQGPDSGPYRVLRGGSWGYVIGGCRSAYRGRLTPGYQRSSNGHGFRVVMEIK
jgi:formylglycine-generating enzyme required for sulfatase activity